MDRVVLAILALVSFYLGYVYLLNHELALRWDNSRRRVLNQSEQTPNEAWESGARRRGVFSIITGILLLGIAAGIL